MIDKTLKVFKEYHISKRGWYTLAEMDLTWMDRVTDLLVCVLMFVL